MKLVKSNLSWIWQTCPWELTNNWRVQWKKEVRFFTQKWTLSEMLQISHAVLFMWVKQCSACFFPEVCFLFVIFRMQKKHIFLRASSGDLLLNEKQKKPFVSLNHGVTIVHEFLTTALLAQVHKVPNGADSSLFCRAPARYEVGPIFFPVLFLYFFWKPRYLFIFMPL